MPMVVTDSIWFTPPMMPATFLQGLCVGIVAVQVNESTGAWKAYLGYGRGSNEKRDAKSIASNGAKVTEAMARACFPQYEELKYMA